ncbi:adenine phosphoribosyltransferase [Pelagibaculum spongiae]|uniref:Adenine phosphoribosyltransferase n=1 Tax=Pelagibaculum spongiae TaxID=2080658 RepID=A0A2V1GWA5_9GAMM|nr:adenine phosphoribosyltransferase [Pelagibaculum spongiae]PVZ68947.1 adenine phosphoribosyltransferase [Pelagibaculum spongiae]
MNSCADLIKEQVRNVPDWPEPGVMFRDITTILQRPDTFRKVINAFLERYGNQEIDVVACIEARGFILGAPLAHQLGVSMIPVRKEGKLPWRTVSRSYDLEYGSAVIEVHEDSFSEGQRVLVVDDLIATGGTMLAACQLVEELGATVVEAASIIDLPELGGSAKLRDNNYAVYTLCDFSDS